MSRVTVALAVLAVIAPAVPADAQLSERVQIHGLGQWSYGRTDGNHHLGGSDQGDYRHFESALGVHASPTDRLRISTLAFWGEDDDGAEIHVDVAFAEWSFSDLLRFRVGRQRVPLGAYGELLELGTARPFFHLAQGIYADNAGIVNEFYQGGSITGAYLSHGGLVITYDVYVGAMTFPEGDGGGNASFFFQEEDGGAVVEGGEEVEPVDDLIGGRITIDTPMDGLSFGLAANTGVSKAEDARRSAYGGNVDYVAEPWHLRAEWFRHTESGEFAANGFYGEAAYRITKHWQVGARYDWAGVDVTEVGIGTDEAPTLLEHQEFGFTLNYWFSPNFVIKASFHLTDGNLFAGPEEGELDAVVAAGALENRTNLFLIGAQFSF